AAHDMLLRSRARAGRKASGSVLSGTSWSWCYVPLSATSSDPFRLVMDSALSDGSVLRQFFFEALHPDRVQIRLRSELTDPSALYTHIVRHPQYCADSQVEWRGTDLQHHGLQTVEELNYIMVSRPEKEMFICFHDGEARVDAGHPVTPDDHSSLMT
ncbi:MAG: hypothetical protein ACKPKO_25435, partial [Candidatus Fonsibacter sp.]